VLFEGTNVSVGRTEKQFQIYGSPYLPQSNFSLSKTQYGAQNPVYNGVACFGEDLSNEHRLRQLELKWLIKTYETTTNKAKFFNPFLQNWPEHENSKQQEEVKSEALERAGKPV
jgi:hypothetical protein